MGKMSFMAKKILFGIPTDPFEEDRPKKADDLGDLMKAEQPATAKNGNPRATPTSPIGASSPEPAERAIHHRKGPCNALFLAFSAKDCGAMAADEFLYPVVEQFGGSWTQAYEGIQQAIQSGELEPMILYGGYCLSEKRTPDTELEDVDCDAILSSDRMAEEPEHELVEMMLAELEEFCIAQDRGKDIPPAVTPASALRTKESFLSDCEGLDGDGLQFYWTVIAEGFRELPKAEQTAALGAYMTFRSQMPDTGAIDALFRKR